MILVDTSIWVNHLRSTNGELCTLLKEVRVVTHPFVIGELACGNLKNRAKVLSFLERIPMVVLARHEEVLQLIDSHNFMGYGIGWIDAHLLASAVLTGVPLWTADRKLRNVAALLGVLY